MSPLDLDPASPTPTTTGDVASALGLEARAQAHDHLDVRVWLRLLALANQIEAQIRQRLRARFATTLSRFDYLAQLERHPDGLQMKRLSSYLMVTGGNVTGLTDELVKDGHVERTDDPQDRRSWRVRLTPAGRAHFAQMAAEHEGWLNELFAGLAPAEKDALYALLGRLRQTAGAAALASTTITTPTTSNPSNPSNPATPA
jgi:DNA-binding MarR family transcriptional regulator